MCESKIEQSKYKYITCISNVQIDMNEMKRSAKE